HPGAPRRTLAHRGATTGTLRRSPPVVSGPRVTSSRRGDCTASATAPRALAGPSHRDESNPFRRRTVTKRTHFAGLASRDFESQALSQFVVAWHHRRWTAARRLAHR